MEQLKIIPTTENDYTSTENITREAFWNLFESGCDEHLILHNLRKSDSWIPSLDLTAFSGLRVAGHVISTQARVENPEGKEIPLLCLGPVSVLPEYQGRGIGSELIRHSISESRSQGFIGIILFGHPGYYHRFGFRNAEHFGITTKDGHNFDAFMALELQKNALDKVSGKFYEDPAFIVSNDELEVFDRQFPAKEKGKPKIKLDE